MVVKGGDPVLSAKRKSLNYRKGLKGLSKRDITLSEYNPYGETFYSEVRKWFSKSKKV